MVNFLWIGKNAVSEQMIADMIEYNLNVGLFNENDELVAWTLT